MRAPLALSIALLMWPVIALAQSQAPTPPPAAPAAAPPHAARGGDITRDEYIERAVERAKTAAAKRFDRMDTDHDGVLTADERAAARAAHAQRRSSTPAATGGPQDAK